MGGLLHSPSLMSLDISTVTLWTAIIAFANAIMLFIYWTVSPCFRGVPAWIGSLLSWALSSVLYSFRFTYPDSPTMILLANYLMMISLVMTLLGTCQFCDEPFWARSVIISCVIVLLGFHYFLFVYPDFMIRSLFTGFFSAEMPLLAAWILWKRTPDGHEKSHRTAVSICAFFGVVNLVRFARIWFLPWGPSPNVNDPIFAITMLANVLFVTPLTTFAFALLMGQRQVISGRETERHLQEARVRLAQQELVRQKQTLLRDLHDGLSGTITAIALNCRQLVSRDIPGADDEILQAIRQLSAMSNHEIRSMMHRVGTEALTWPDLLRELHEFATALFQPAGLQCHWESTPTPEEPISNVAAASSFIRMVKEAIHNVLRHSGASAATVRWTFQPERLRVEIIDNGTGIASDRSPGRGLNHMSARARELGGTADYVSHPGLSVRFSLPLPLALTPHEGSYEVSERA